MARGQPVDLSRAFCDALIAGHQVEAEQIARDALSGGMSLADLYVEVMSPALAEVGERWAAGGLSVADEHLATSIVESVMARVGRSPDQAPSRDRERVLMAGVELEGHVVGLRMLADLAEEVAALHRRGDVAVVVGGSGVTSALREDPRVAYAPDVREALAVLERVAAPSG